jgi:carboxyl-terminal processing protease
LYARTVKENPVPVATTISSPAGKRAGYVLFNDHSEGAQDKLITAVQQIQMQGLSELVLDMRYNSGGYLYIAQALASMVSSVNANGRIFESLRYNDKRTADSRAGTFSFATTVQYPEATFPAGYRLPKLGLRRVYVLTSDETCSASESVINGLRGVDVEVVLIGANTCGKPFGFTRKDNCAKAYFPIEFQGTNAKGFGDYSAGFAPTCAANDDLDHALGQAAEGQLANALHHLDTGLCAAAPPQGALIQARKSASGLLSPDAPQPPHGRLLRMPQTQ